MEWKESELEQEKLIKIKGFPRDKKVKKSEIISGYWFC